MNVTIAGQAGQWRVQSTSSREIGAARRILLFHGYGQTAAEFMPLAHALALHGFDSWVDDLPGHGANCRILDFAEIMEFAQKKFDEVRPFAVIGYSLGARIALSLKHKKIIAISPPMNAEFSRSHRNEILETLRLRWVREPGPMKGLSECIQNLSIDRVSDCFSGLMLYAERDLSSVKDHLLAGFSTSCIPEADHLSILHHPETLLAILKELRK